MLRLAARLKREHARKLLRVCWPARAKAEIGESVLRYCVTSGRTLAAHQRRFSRQDIEACSVIVTTMLGANEIARVGVGIEGFTHMILDEAAQVPEPLVLIPLSLAGRRCRLVLCGDHKQLLSWGGSTSGGVVSAVGKHLGLAVSIVERMASLPIYGGGSGAGAGMHLKVLVRNYRNHPFIVRLAAQMLYGGHAGISVACEAGVVRRGGRGTQIQPSHWHAVQGVAFPVLLVGVQGKLITDDCSPSPYNNFEALQVAERAHQLVI